MVKNIPATLSNSQLYYHNKPCSTRDSLTHKIKHIHSFVALLELVWLLLLSISFVTYQGQNYSKVKGDKNKGEKYLFIHKAVRFIHIVSTRGNFSHQDLSTRLERPQSASGRASWTEERAGWGRKPLSEEE